MEAGASGVHLTVVGTDLEGSGLQVVVSIDEATFRLILVTAF